MKCMYCGADNPQQAQACVRCGRELQAARPVRRRRAEDTRQPDEAGEARQYVYSPDEVIQSAPDYGETEPFAPTRQTVATGRFVPSVRSMADSSMR